MGSLSISSSSPPAEEKSMSTSIANPATPPLSFQVRGMTCASCVLRVEKALKAVDGVRDATVNLATEKVSVSAATSVAASQLAAAVQKAGYDVATREVQLQIKGMTCASCVSRVEKALLKVSGVLGATVNLATERATISALASVTEENLQVAVRKAGSRCERPATPPVLCRMRAHPPARHLRRRIGCRWPCLPL
jgi:Cu+-exporting ATPase